MTDNIYLENDHFKPLEEAPRKRIYTDFNISSVYIPMPDGVKIAADIALPAGIGPEGKLSTVLVQTRYWRSAKLRVPFCYFLKSAGYSKMIKVLTSFGYALVYVDVRGTGASLGTRVSPWNEDEVKDMKDIMDWIVAQPWSDGNVLPVGISYSGTTAELALVANHPAVKGSITMFNELDPFLDIAFPGGVYNDGFVEKWAQANESLDGNTSKGMGFGARLLLKGVNPVETDKDKSMIKEAVKQHASNGNVAILSRNVSFRDENFSDKISSSESFSVYRYQNDIEKSNLPIYYWGSWMDASTSNVVLGTFLTFKNPIIGVIGAWTHGAAWKANPYSFTKKEIKLDPEIIYQAWVHFIDSCIKGKAPSEKILFYYTIVEEKWKRTTEWPPAGHSLKRWYFQEKNGLSTESPKEESGEDKYKINYNASTGKNNRWYTQMGGGPVIYKDRIKEDEKLLTYTSAPLDKDIEITGHPIINLYLSSTHEDGAIFAYLEDMDENGNSFLITEGQFRVIHRKISSETPLYKIGVPYHTYKKADALPLVPGEVAEIQFALIPTSIIIRKGHRIRIAIGGADKDTFTRLPKEGNPEITVSRNNKHASFIKLPVIQ